MTKPDSRDFEERYSACFLDFGLKIATGVLLGSMLGSFFLRNRRWPAIIGGGFGFGMAYANCENSLNGFLLSKDPLPCKIKSERIMESMMMPHYTVKCELKFYNLIPFGQT